jgi:processive 1,2-diacylglycerol beta-glucosyltransferase
MKQVKILLSFGICLLLTLSARIPPIVQIRDQQVLQGDLAKPRLVPKAKQRKGLPARKETPAPKKRIVVFSSCGGGGHTAVSNGLKTYLGDDYDVTIVNAFQEVLGSVDTLGAITFGGLSGEDFYNFCMRCRWTNVIGGFAKTGGSYMAWREDDIENLIIEYFELAKPDLLISVVPFINAATRKAAEKLDIPFLVLTNDLDTTNYINAFAKCNYAKFRYSLAFDDPVLKEKIKKAHIPEDQLVITGFPLRPDFFKEKDCPAIRKDFKVPDGKPVVMVFMGGAGSLASYRYVRTLAKLDMPMHILVCLGRNMRLSRNINKILLPPEVTLTIIGFTDRISDLMGISDVLITKPGPGSVCEALECNVPMILDKTGGAIWWEELNIEFVEKYGFGETLVDFADLSTILPKYIKDSRYSQAVKKKMRSFKRERFEDKIKLLVEEMMAL